MNNYNREKNRKRKIHSSGANTNKNTNKKLNDMDYVLIKARTPNFMGKKINNNKQKKENIKKPHTPEIKNIQSKYNKDIENKKLKRPSTAPHNNIQVKNNK